MYLYERNVEHCELSPYVKMVTIANIESAENSDFLERISFDEMGWNAIAQKGLHSVGNQVMFIPPESVLPFELSEKLNVTKYLSKGKVKVAKFRGNRSEGIIVPLEIVEPYLDYILKWEDLPSIQMAGQQMSPSWVSPDFHTFYKMPNILNEPKTFSVGDELYYSEKIHGTNFRFGYLKNPQEEYQLYVGSHNIVLLEREENLYWQVMHKMMKNITLPRGIEFFAEIFGTGVQDLSYGLNVPQARVFAASRKGTYIPIDELKEICRECEIPIVYFHETVFENVEQIRALADEKSEVTDKHIREGIVLVSKNRPEKMAKCIGFEYLIRNGKKTERH